MQGLPHAEKVRREAPNQCWGTVEADLLRPLQPIFEHIKPTGTKADKYIWDEFHMIGRPCFFLPGFEGVHFWTLPQIT